MAAKSYAILLAGVMSGVAVSLLCVTAALLWDGHSLRQRLQATATEAADLRSQQADAQAKLDHLATDLAQLRRESAPAEATDTPTAPRRARIVRGNQVVGWGWVHSPPAGGEASAASADLPASVVLDPAATPAASSPANAYASGAASPSAATPYPAYQHWWYSHNYGPSYLLTSGWIDGGHYHTNNCPDPQPPFAPPQSPVPDPAFPPPAVTPQPDVTVRTAAVAPPRRRPSPTQPTVLPRRFPTTPVMAPGAPVMSRSVPMVNRAATPASRASGFNRTPTAAALPNRAAIPPRAGATPFVRR